MQKLLKTYLRRLTNLTSRNRSLLLLSLPQEQFLDLHQLDWAMTPYVSTGINYFIYNEKYILGTRAETDYRDSALAIPMVVGIKTRVLESFILGFEVGARYTFTDNLDGSNPKNDNFESVRFGNLGSNDWYVFTGFTLTYTFGDNPCFCAE
mgnify:CR=1 FL=1